MVGSWSITNKRERYKANAVFILGFEKSGGSARKLCKNVGDFQKVWGL